MNIKFLYKKKMFDGKEVNETEIYYNFDSSSLLFKIGNKIKLKKRIIKKDGRSNDFLHFVNISNNIHLIHKEIGIIVKDLSKFYPIEYYKNEIRLKTMNKKNTTVYKKGTLSSFISIKKDGLYDGENKKIEGEKLKSTLKNLLGHDESFGFYYNFENNKFIKYTTSSTIISKYKEENQKLYFKNAIVKYKYVQYVMEDGNETILFKNNKIIYIKNNLIIREFKIKESFKKLILKKFREKNIKKKNEKVSIIYFNEYSRHKNLIIAPGNLIIDIGEEKIYLQDEVTEYFFNKNKYKSIEDLRSTLKKNFIKNRTKNDKNI